MGFAFAHVALNQIEVASQLPATKGETVSVRAVSAILIFLLGGCGAYGAKPLQAPKAQVLTTGSLSAHHLSVWPGQCALVLRPRPEDGAPAEAPFFAQSDNDVTMILEGRQVSLRRTESSSDLVTATLPRSQAFVAPTLSAKLLIRQSDSSDGAPLQGVLSLTKPNGWSTVIPVDGGRRCRQ
ncbi:hypothetical protein SAMN04488071_1799 [Kordiimonas lacus]|uniref:Uncharacterized protein n=1 Tax=Kordiimonas lacus TaxID=637679 RepID=A0A1G6ZGZ8_9PROT|nr:hypothetical protein SAMN04488071_1799 [Kordiimonas lacus]